MADPDYPLLVFPAPVPADRAKPPRGSRLLNCPTPREQGKRLMPKFQRLMDALERQRIELQSSSLGIEPEKVLVIEIVGTVEKFFQAIQNISGLEWLAEYNVGHIQPSYGFEDAKHPEKSLNGRLFVLMSDVQALTELCNLFDLWWKRDSKVKFRHGLAPLKEVFKLLHDIRPWSVKDRLIDNGLFEEWKEWEAFGQTEVFFEAEMWYRKNTSRREVGTDTIRRLIRELDGQIVTECVIQDIAYHSILGQAKIPFVRHLIHQPEAREELALFQCEGIMFIRPVGQCAVPVDYEMDEVASPQLGKLTRQTEGTPVVALLDGMPLTRHDLLNGRIVVDDPDEYEESYQAKERNHGTVMASLICHGDLNSQTEEPIERPIYVRPIMRPGRRFGNDGVEAIPDKVLPVDVVHRAIIRMFDGEGKEPPTSPGIRVVNLSVGDRARQFVGDMSGWARLLDWLSYKYNLLFIVSAGNHDQKISLRTQAEGLQGLSKEECQQLVISAVVEDTRNRRLLSPAETINGITVGALHMDEAGPAPNHLIDPLLLGMPSFISAHGPGYRRAIKPEILLPGGRQLLSEDPIPTDGTIVVHTNNFQQPLGQRVAVPGTKGTLNATILTRGTSNSAALGTRRAYFFYELLETLRTQLKIQIPEEFDAVLIKALLVHGAKWGQLYSRYSGLLERTHDRRTLKDYLGNFLGYGTPDFGRVVTGTRNRVTILGFGALYDGNACEFAMPLPPSLSGINEKRHVTITLAWFSPVNCFNYKYRVAHLWFSKPKAITSSSIGANHHAVNRGTIQHAVFEENNAVVIEDGDSMMVKVNCRKDAGAISQPIRFGVAVTLEIMEPVLFPISIYEEVRERIQVRVRTVENTRQRTAS